ncbi:MAG: hypothetical protein V4596_08830 [Bdellovibrionota bacterium]
MKQLKSEDKQGLNAKKLSKNSRTISRIFYILKNNKGLSLIELMVTTMIGIIVSMGIASVFVFAMEQFTILVEKNAAEESVLMSTYNLRNYLSQAVDLNVVDSIDNAAVIALNGGGQLDFDFELLVPAQSEIGDADSGEFARFAVFNREAGTYNIGAGSMPNGGSQMRPTGIFVKDTDVNGLNPDAQSGALVFDTNSTTGNMIPGPSDFVHSRLHNFRVQRIAAGAANCPGGYAIEVVVNSGAANNGTLLPCLGAAWGGGTPGERYKIKTLTVEVWTRYFKTSDKSSWNYRAPVGGAATAPYRDIVQTVKINFKNNVLTTESLTGEAGAEERVHGSLYFYDYIMPGVGVF